MMTGDLARRIFDEFRGKSLNGYTVEVHHRNGGTSVILLGQSRGETVAIKVYEMELFEGKDGGQARAELERISRQLSMKDHTHPNLVRTRCAGLCDRTGYRYVIMDYVPDPTLEEVLNDVPRERVRDIIQQVAKATLFLQETLKHVHRDIKPANIALRRSDFHVTLLDLGLVRPITGDTATDHGASRIVGTKRYAPPELLDGTVTHDANGWLAVSFYQLGGILHDLIMRKQLFDDYDSGGPLHNAIRQEVPKIDAADVPADLVQLARDCLQKDPLLRLKLVTWNRFLSTPDPDAAGNELDRLRTVVGRVAPRPTLATAFPDGAPEQHARETALVTLNRAIEYSLRNLFRSDDTLFPLPVIDEIGQSASSFMFRVVMRYPGQCPDISVTMFISCTVLDVASLACQCKLVTCLGAITTPPANASGIQLYHGTFVAAAFATTIDREIPKALTDILATKAQEMTIAAPGEQPGSEVRT